MGLIRALVGGGGRGPADDFWYQPVSGGSSFGTGGAETLLSASPVWAGVRLLADSVAAAPLITYRRLKDGGKVRATDHPVYDLLHDQPNKLQTAYAFKRVLMVHALLWGNAYAKIVPGPRGPVDTLVPIHPDGVRVEKIPGGIRYMVRGDSGLEEPLNDEDVFHLPGLSLDGVSGLSVMRIARESIELNLEAKRYSSGFFKKGGRPAGVIKHPAKLSKEGRDNLRDSWQEIHGGTQGAHKIAVLTEGMEWQATGITNEDATLLGTLEWSAADCARYFNVPLHLIQETSKVTSWGSGIEELNSAFVTFSLLPWLVNWQQTITKDMIVASRLYFVEFLVDALLRGKTKERFEAYQIAAGGNAPWMTRNEIRRAESMNALDGLDEPLQPLNMGSGAAPAGGAPAAELLARDAAGSVIRREIGAIEKGAGTVASGSQAWRALVDSVYGDHAAYVARRMHLSAELAERYVAEQRSALLAGGPPAMDTWLTHRAEELAALALEGRP